MNQDSAMNVLCHGSEINSIFLLEFNVLNNTSKQLKPLPPSCFLFKQDLSRYFDAGLIQVSNQGVHKAQKKN
jgi:hypothetical protein